jgi:M6 family metalloprotease-like protein
MLMRRARPVVALLASAPLLLLSYGQAPGATAAAKSPHLREPKLVAALRVTTPPGRSAVRPGASAPVTGTLRNADGKAVGGTVTLRVSDPGGRELGRIPGVKVAPDGSFSAVVPGSVTRLAHPTKDTGYVQTLAVRAVDAKAGGKTEAFAGSVPLAVAAAVAGLEIENDFTSSKGWVKPGETYPFRVTLRNYDGADTGVEVTLPEVAGMRFLEAEPGASSGTAAIASGTITWTVGSIAAGTAESPKTATLIVQARAETTSEDPEVVWKDISTTATLAYDSGTGSSRSHGPKVIPQDDIYNTARYGDRPFPVVPVDYADRAHTAEHTGELLSNKINDPGIIGSTFNLYQEMSYKQLYPHATVPSAGIGSAPFDSADKIAFSTPQPNGACYPDAVATQLGRTAAQGTTGVYEERIKDGWYQLPGDTNYYGLDKYGFQAAYLGAASGQAALFDIDSACGSPGKAVYDAAAIADAEIDYSDFDTDKDGVVDFFMMVFAGVGGHGQSITEVPPYDNIWPHSSSLEFSFTDPVTKLGGYMSHDQLKDLLDRPLWYTDDSYTSMTTTDMGDDLVVHVRVGPYNVNPENAIDKASVISHEYGHSLGLPDFYSTGSRDTYGDWNLMATDKSQNMDVFSKQDMGWIVPRVLPRNATTVVTDWQDSKVNTHQIDWVKPDGTPYTLSGQDVANGEAYTAKLKGRQLISPDKVSQGASPSHVWWSGSGNDFGCPPTGGHNMDISLPELKDVAPGTKVTLEFKSFWDVEWDYDYGFVLVSPDSGQTYTSVASDKNYTTPAVQNPNNNSCQAKYGNGITGTSGSYQANTAPADRVTTTPGGTQYPDGPFLADSYDISSLVGAEAPVLRFSYATDPGLAHPGWFIDNLVVKAGSETIYESDFEDFGADRDRIYNGGCKEELKVATLCTKGWQWISSSVDATADHGYYLEMRDRSGFDYDGKGENDRAAIGFVPGLLLTYTDEAHGYGNAGTDDPPAQSPLDANPTAGSSTPQLNDAAFSAGGSFADNGWVDNYKDPSTESGNWEFRFNCLQFKVNGMSGDEEGPDSATGVGGDLLGDVTFHTTKSCAEFNYGYTGDTSANTAPTARLAVKPESPVAGLPASFDASESFDDQQASSDLTYAWAFGDGGKASGRTVQHTYAKAGTYTVTVTVTDADGLSTTESRSVQVRAAGSPGGGGTSHPATGGSAPLALLAVLGSGVAVALRRRAASV